MNAYQERNKEKSAEVRQTLERLVHLPGYGKVARDTVGFEYMDQVDAIYEHVVAGTVMDALRVLEQLVQSGQIRRPNRYEVALALVQDNDALVRTLLSMYVHPFTKDEYDATGDVRLPCDATIPQDPDAYSAAFNAETAPEVFLRVALNYGTDRTIAAVIEWIQAEYSKAHSGVTYDVSALVRRLHGGCCILAESDSGLCAAASFFAKGEWCGRKHKHSDGSPSVGSLSLAYHMSRKNVPRAHVDVRSRRDLVDKLL